MENFIIRSRRVLYVIVLIILHCECHEKRGWGRHQNHHQNWGHNSHPNHAYGPNPIFGNGWQQWGSNNEYENINNEFAHQAPDPVFCPRPFFLDDAQLKIENCVNGDSHSTCADHKSHIPEGWKIFMVCRKGSLKIQRPSVCSPTGDWVPPIYQTCNPLFGNQKFTHQSTHPISPQLSDPPTTTQIPQSLIPYLNSDNPLQCSMLKMHLSDNFLFTCLFPGTSNEVHDCIHLKKVPSGTVVKLKCKPPFHSDHHSEWLCEENETWKGDFNHKLKCFYAPGGQSSQGPIQSHPTPTTTLITTTTSTTTETPYIYRTTIQSNRHRPSNIPIVIVRPSTTLATTTTTSTTTPPPIIETSTRPPRRKTTTITTSTQSPLNINSPTCPPLTPRSPGIALECVSKTKSPITQAEEISLNSCNIPQPVDAEAKYTCKRYYESTAGLVTIYRKCKADGTWTGSADSFNCVIECGRNNEVFVPFITSGKPSFRGQWPWHSAVFLKETVNQKTKWTYICGGTLVSSRTIITAAHCVTFVQSSRVRNSTSFRFDLGRFDREKPDDIVQSMDVESIHLHPSYSPYGYDSDIAVIILKESVSIGYHVRPICFPQTLNSALEELQLAENSLGTVVGWGYNENFQLEDQLQQAQLKVASAKDCSDSARGQVQAKSTTYCAGPKNASESVNVCIGDSGGGMYFPLTNSDFTRWYIQGIVSVGIADEKGHCKPSQNSFFTRVGRYADWMVRVMSEYNAL